MCYRDMTFCPFYEDCKHREECHRPLTPEVVKKAEEWWGGPDAPIAEFTSKPNCYEQIETEGA